MAKPALTLRSEKGAALSFAEMDTNLGNLANAVIQVTAGGTTSNIDLNSGFIIANTATVAATITGNTVSLTTLANLANPGPIGNTTPSSGTFTTVTTSGNVTLNGNYLSNAVFENVREKVYAMGSVTGTVSIDANLGSIQTATVTGNITINTNDLSNFQTGETVSVVLTQATNTSIRILTSNIRYAGGQKTLTAANAAIDTIHITYDGTNYLAVLIKEYN